MVPDAGAAEAEPPRGAGPAGRELLPARCGRDFGARERTGSRRPPRAGCPRLRRRSHPGLGRVRARRRRRGRPTGAGRSLGDSRSRQAARRRWRPRRVPPGVRMRTDRATKRAIAACAAVLCAGLLAPGGAAADRGSLYRGPGPRPGPDLLYAKPPRAPQLANRGVWRAAPILVSGATAYRRGEFLYQDFLYDDHGAAAERDPDDPRGAGHTFAQPNGSYTYPSARAYAENAADIVELRVRPLRRATAFRLTLNTMLDPSLVGWTLAIGSSPAAGRVAARSQRQRPGSPLPYRARPPGGAAKGERGAQLSPAPEVSISRRRRQVQVLSPAQRLEPRPRDGPPRPRRRPLGPDSRRLPDSRRSPKRDGSRGRRRHRRPARFLQRRLPHR